MKRRKIVKPEKVTFEAVAHHLPEGYFEQYLSKDLNEDMRIDFEKRIRKANRPVGQKSKAVLDKRSIELQKLYIKIKDLTEDEADQFEALCSELTEIRSLIGIDEKKFAMAKLADKYRDFIKKGLMIAYRTPFGSTYNCEIKMQPVALEFCKSLRAYHSYHSYSELL